MSHKLTLLLFVVLHYAAVAQQAAVTQRLDNLQSAPAALLAKPAGTVQASASLSQHKAAGFEHCELVLKHHYKSLLGDHYFYQQVYNNTPVYGCYLKVSLDAKGNVLSSYHTLVKTEELEIPKNGRADYYVVHDNKLLPALNAKEGHHFTLKQADGTVLYSQDKRLYYTDTVVKAMVFNPDPLTSAGVQYGQGGTYRNFNDSDYALLNDQRVLRTFPARFSDGAFRLENEYCRISELVAPAFVPSTSVTGEFFFPRSQYGFKEVMAMYHTYAAQLFIQSLGFDEVNYQLKIDPHASDNDNSYFSYDEEGDTLLRFGLGGVPDAEDADVIVHEYTHAISYSLNPDGIISMERRAIEEGLCDAMACAYSKKLNAYRWRDIFTWDGYNEFWNGRDGTSNKTYEDRINSYYSDSEIWSSAMNNLSAAIGEEALIRLMLAVIPQFTPNTTMPQAAWLMYHADSILNNRVNQVALSAEFNARKFDEFPVGLNDLANDRNFSIRNTMAFANGTGDAVIALKQSGEFTAEVFDVSGRKTGEARTNTLLLKPEQYKPGIYFVSVSYNDLKGYYKLVRY